MTVSSTQSRISHAGDGATTDFPVPFYFIEPGHLVVSLVLDDDTITPWTLGTDYSAAGAGNQSGGTVTAFDAPAVGETLIIERIVPSTQETAYQENDPFPAKEHERALDKLTMVGQQHEEVLGLRPGASVRVLRLPASDPGIPLLPDAATRANKALVFDENGNPKASDDDYNDQAASAAASAAAALASEQAAQAAQQASENARNDSIAIATQFGDVAGAIAAATAQAGIATTQALVATAQAGIATEAADTSTNAASMALIQAGVYVDEPTGRAAVADGQAFKSQGAGDVAAFEWRRLNAGASVLIATYPSTAAVKKLPSTLATAGEAVYTGAGPVVPFTVDANGKVLLGYDIPNDKVVGVGLIDDAAVESISKEQLGEFSLLGYTGAGVVYPLLVDALNRVLLGYHTGQDKIIGAGLADNAGSSSEPPTPLPSALRPIVRALNGMLGYGQSNSVGAGDTAVISTTQPYANRTYGSGARAYQNNFSSTKLLVEDNQVPAPDGSSNRGETFCSGAANYASTLAAIAGIDPATRPIFASTAGQGGTPLAGLQKGTGTNWYMDHFIPHINGAVASNPSYAIHAVPWIHGESDSDTTYQTSFSTYRAGLVQLQADAEADIKTRTGQTSPVFFLVSQLSSYVTAWPDVALALLDLCKTHDRFYMTTPFYHLPFAAESRVQHLTSVGHKWLGAYIGRAYHQLVDMGVEPQFLNPLSATRRGADIRVRFKVPTRPLVLDITSLAPTTDCGLRVTDANGQVPISAISIDGDDVVISLGATPSGATTVSYALHYLGAGLTIHNGASGNIRDSTSDTITIGGIPRPLYHVAPAFRLPVIVLGE